jgi:hypothetical protein
MTNKDAPESSQLRSMVDESIVVGQQAKSRFRAARAEDVVDEGIRRDLRQALINLHNVMKNWRDDPGVRDVWEEEGLEVVEQWINNGNEVRVQTPGAGRSSKTKQVPLIQQIDPERIAAAIDGLHEVARELGFMPQTSERTILEKGTLNDVKWLVTVRGQTPALEDLHPPKIDEEKMADGGVTPTPQGSRYPFRGPFFREISNRKDQGKDAKISVSSANAETGVGKSTCAFYLAHVLDNSPDGFRAEEKATLNVQDFMSLYDSLPKGSAAILDEAEQIDSRRAMSQENVDAAEHWQKRRVQEICALLTLPKFDVLDKRMRNLVDYRVEVHARGEATIYKKSLKPFTGGIWWQELQEFSFPSMDGLRGMEHLHELKEEHIGAGGDGSAYVSAEEADEKVEQEVEKELKQQKKELAKSLYRDSDMSQTDLAEKFGVDQTTIHRWVN